MPHRSALRFAAAAGLAWLGLCTTAALAGQLGTTATPESPNAIRVNWSWYENPASPTGHPEWTGYDVYRLVNGGCAAWVRLNPEVIPRVYGVSQDATLLDTAPVPATSYAYRIALVDASRTELFLPYPACDWPCSVAAYAEVPPLSAPVVEGVVSDWGWTVFVSGCTNTCWSSFYLDPAGSQLLRPHAGTGQVVRCFGEAGCGSVEGCALWLDRFELLGLCGSTPARATTWGALKSHYR